MLGKEDALFHGETLFVVIAGDAAHSRCVSSILHGSSRLKSEEAEIIGVFDVARVVP